MNNIEFSDHKNYTEQYGRNRKVLIENEILPVEESIFRLFSIKFNRDADKDLERKRKKLCDLGKSCSNDLDEIHSIIRKRKIYNENDNDEENAFDMAIEIIDMDYGSVYDFFSTLKAQYSNDSEIYPLLDHICNNISEMRKISKKHTNIISK